MQVFKQKAQKSLKELVRVLISAVGTWVDILLKGGLRPEISPLYMKVLTLIKVKSNVFL